MGPLLNDRADGRHPLEESLVDRLRRPGAAAVHSPHCSARYAVDLQSLSFCARAGERPTSRAVRSPEMV